MQAEVIVFRGVKTTFTYSLTNQESISIGDIVEVPFGKSKTKACVISISSIQSRKTKPILKRLDTHLPIPEQLVSLITWFRGYYQTTPYKAFQTVCGLKRKRAIQEKSDIHKTTEPPTLTPSQHHIVSDIKNKWETKKHVYIHGITGSGKSELYFNLATFAIEKGKQVLFLLPEIALTPQFTTLLISRFGQNVAVLHSGLTAKQKEEEWNRIQEGLATIIVGPRSAIFAPTTRLGLIIIDEEHEPSYKQDNHPRYLTHTIAEKRAENENALLCLGSATPNIERYKSAKYNHAVYSLTERATGAPLPNVRIIDMKEEASLGLKSHFSSQLISKITATLEDKKKVLILLNRRGYATQILCQRCGASPRCPECHLGYTYHNDKTFRCHRCAIKKEATNFCDNCNKYALAFFGLGTQKVDLELKRTFPNASILRLDRDTAKNLSAIESILTEFKESGDILIGTQMIAKGHDIKNVSLVGVLGIDSTLMMPDFRSPERTFQLLTQVAGRAGRHDDEGEVIVQSYNADHYAIQAAKHHDFLAFYEKELHFRETLSYPPYCDLVNIIFSGLDPISIEAVISDFHKKIVSFISTTSIQVMGPKPAPIEKVRDHYRWNIVFKCNHEDIDYLKSLIQIHLPDCKGIRIVVDFDPYHIL